MPTLGQLNMAMENPREKYGGCSMATFDGWYEGIL